MGRKTLDLPPFPPFFLFLAVLLAKDLAQEEALSSQHVTALEEVGLRKIPYFLKFDC